MSVAIRLFTLDDLDVILAIEQVCFTIDGFTEGEFRELYAECYDLFLVAEVAGQIVGYMITCTNRGIGEIASIAVYPDFRRQGIAQALLHFTLSGLFESGIRRIELEVRLNNLPGLHFWKQAGFIPVGIIHAYYRDGADALKMRKLSS